MSVNTLQDKQGSSTARDFILVLAEPAHIVDNQPMLAKYTSVNVQGKEE